ncbi:hypothetical protein LSM04_008388 [Trypanosoma melophagium]|uniref:uncharacterized protein n=1 Tax=Trypanosoma melophagium TaxID=715481 RepID=UPI00351A219A|nr:hypothetical protein LSM04_008388 [Trypanosoma melophagium]
MIQSSAGYGEKVVGMCRSDMDKYSRDLFILRRRREKLESLLRRAITMHPQYNIKSHFDRERKVDRIALARIAREV